MIIGTREQTIVNGQAVIGFRHFYDGVLVNPDELISVSLLDPLNYTVKYVVPSGDIQNPEPGVYTATIPENVLNQIGLWRDQWRVRSVTAATERTFQFTVNVVQQLTQLQSPTLDSITSCSIDDLSACAMKKYFLWPVWGVLSNGYYLQDAVLQYHIDNAISWLERHVGVPLGLKRVRTRPYSDETLGFGSLQISPGGNPIPPPSPSNPGDPVLGVDFEEEGQLIQWNQTDSEHWSTIRLPHTNVIRILGVRGVYGGRTVYRIPDAWVERNQLSMGFVRIRPTTTGSIANIVDGSGRFLDVTLLESIGMSSVPGFWAVDYDYGFDGGKVPRDLCQVIMKKAAVLLLDQLGQAITKGLSGRSASVDGLSSSTNFVANSERTLFGALARRYEEELDAENLTDLRRYYKGPSVFIT